LLVSDRTLSKVRPWTGRTGGSRKAVLRATLDWHGASIPRLGALVVTADGLMADVPVAEPQGLALDWVVAAAALTSAVGLAVVAWLGAIDARLRAHSTSLPAAAIAVVMGVLWLAYLLASPGTLPALAQVPAADDTSAWLYLLINAATPSFLALAALHVPRTLPNGGQAARFALSVGLFVGLGLAALAVALGISPLDSIHGDQFDSTAKAAAVGGVLPVGAAGFLLLRGHRGDERVLRGTVPALAVSGVNSLVLIWLVARHTPVWYAIHVLPTATAISLLFGQINLYSRSVQTELRAVARLEGSFATAEALALSLRPAVVIDKLLERSMAAVEADEALLCHIRGDTIVVDASRPLPAAPTVLHRSLALRTVPYIEAAVRQLHAQVAKEAVSWIGPSAHRYPAASAGHVLAVPLVLGNDTLGVLAFLRTSGLPFGHGDEAAVGTIGTVAALALRNARLFAEVEEVSQAKSMFLNMAAHELRTPLSVIRGYASMLRDGSLDGLPSESKNAVAILQSKSDELAQLVDAILMASRIEAGGARPRSRVTDLRAAVEAAVDRLRPSAALRSAEIEVVLPAEPVPVHADVDHVARILDNLLANGLAYSLGRPWLRISIACTWGIRAEVAVEDHGVGLRHEDHERIFGRFERVEHPELGFSAGTGVGLYLSRRLAQAMRGSLRLDRSSPGRGSRFVLELPVLLDPCVRRMSSVTSPEGQSGRPSPRGSQSSRRMPPGPARQ